MQRIEKRSNLVRMAVQTNVRVGKQCSGDKEFKCQEDYNQALENGAKVADVRKQYAACMNSC